MINWRQIFSWRTETHSDEWEGWLVEFEGYERYAVVVLVEEDINRVWGYFADTENQAIYNFNYLKSHPEARTSVLRGGELTCISLIAVEKVRYVEDVNFEVNFDS